MKNFIKNNKAVVIAASIFLIVIVVLGIFLVNKLKPNENIEVYNKPQMGQEEVITPVDPIKEVTLKENATELKAKYPDVIGWIKISNTTINNAVFHADNNTRYERHNRDNVNDQRGEYFLDYVNSIDEVGKEKKNIIVYGHNTLKEGELFTELLKYEKKEFYDNNKIIEFSTTEGNYKWEIFSVYHANANYKTPNFFYYWNVIFENDSKFDKSSDTFAQFISKSKSRSLYDTGVEVKDTDTILTLSTCGNDQSSGQTDERFVVQAKLIKE